MNLLLRVQQGIELRQIRRGHDDRRRGRQRRARLGQGDHRHGGQRGRVREQDPQRIVDRHFAVMGGVLEDLQILLRAQPVIAAGAEPIVGEAEPGRRKQVVAIDVVGERARLPHQLVDDVPVVDGVLVATDQPRPRLHVAVGVPDLDAVGEQPGFDPFADQPAVDRIGVAMDVDQAAGVDAAADLQTTVEPGIGQLAEPGQLLGETVAPAGVAGRHHVPQEGRVLGAADEVAAAAQEQCLIDGGLEVPVR
jgi:hypothetical protein